MKFIKEILLLASLIFATSFVFSADNVSKLELKSNEIINGIILNSSFLFKTIYGSISIPPSFIISIEIGDKENKLRSIYDEIITGYLGTEYVELKTGETKLKIQKENIRHISINYVIEGKKIYSSYLEMKNGDRLFGEITNDLFQITTTYGTLDIPFKSISKIEDIEGTTKVFMVNGNIMQGYISSPYLNVKLNYGVTIDIPKSSVKIVNLNQN